MASAEITAFWRVSEAPPRDHSVLPSACPIVEVLSKSRGYMIRCGRGEVALALATLAMDLNYDNFVEKFTDQQGSSRSEGHEPLWQAINAQ